MLIGHINAGLPINRINSVAIAVYATTFCAKQFLQNSAAIELKYRAVTTNGFFRNGNIYKEKSEFLPHSQTGYRHLQTKKNGKKNPFTQNQVDFDNSSVREIVITMHKKCYNRWRALYGTSNSAYHLLSCARI
jgi:hypothetical protein